MAVDLLDMVVDLLDIEPEAPQNARHLLRDRGVARDFPHRVSPPATGRNVNTPLCRRRREAIPMRYAIRNASLALVLTLLLCFCLSVSAQIRFEDFSNTSQAQQLLRFNNSQNGMAGLATWNDQAVLRLTDGGPNLEASSVYFRGAISVGSGKQPVAGGFTTWFQFQVHSPSGCCVPGDGFAFIIQNSSATDTTYGATGQGITALGAGGNTAYPSQTGALGYAGVNNNLVIEFDIAQDLWDPNGNHIAIQTCGPNTNTPVHETGDFTIGNNDMVTSCLLNQNQQSIDTMIGNIGDNCNGETCTDGAVHNVVIGYTPPKMGQQQGLLQIWLDPTFVMGTHIPQGMPTMSVPYNIVYDATSNPSGLQLDPANGGSAWVGFTASQPATPDRRRAGGGGGANGGTAQDIFGWEFTLSSPVQITQTIQPGGVPTMFAFGAHETDVTYPAGFQNPTGIQMTVTATPVDRQTFYPRLVAGGFPNEQCIVYGGTGGGNPPSSTNGNCIVYSYMCQDQSGPVTCPTEIDPTIVVDTIFDTMDRVNANNADYLENGAIGQNDWMSIFTGFQSAPIDGTTTGGTKGFGSSGGSKPFNRSLLTGQVMNAEIVATFCPNKTGGGASASGCSTSLSRPAASGGGVKPGK
jgi:hypothetical protein